MATANAIETTNVASRSVAARAPSTARDHVYITTDDRIAVRMISGAILKPTAAISAATTAAEPAMTAHGAQSGSEPVTVSGTARAGAPAVAGWGEGRGAGRAR